MRDVVKEYDNNGTFGPCVVYRLLLDQESLLYCGLLGQVSQPFIRALYAEK